MNKLAIALTVAFSTTASMAMAEDIPACSSLVSIDLNSEMTFVQEDLRYYASIVGCELYKEQQSQSNNLPDAVKILQKFINAESEDQIDVDGVLGPDTALAYIRLAINHDYYEPFLDIDINSTSLEFLFLKKIMNEIERQNSPAYDLATGLAGLHNSETNQLPTFVIPTPPELPLSMLDQLLNNLKSSPDCNKARKNIYFEGACFIDTNYEAPVNPSLGKITLSL